MSKGVLIKLALVLFVSFPYAVGATTIYLNTPLITPANVPERGVPAWQADDFYQ